MPSPAAPSSKRTHSAASSKQSGKKEAVDDDDAKPYVIVNDIGKGSFATVYKGYHEDTKHTVAVKAIRRDILTAKLFDNLQSEIDILKSLSHRHITKLIDIVRAERNIYLIMEYCSGGDLTNYIKKRGRVENLQYAPSEGAALQYYPHSRTGGLDEIVVRSFLRQLARALKFLRHRNLIHRDIKPQNLLLNPASKDELAKGHPLGVPILKVADFGFARSLPNQMMAETLCGSPLYMAPEILRYEKYDAKADLWSVGAVLYEMAVGKPPFRAQNHVELLKKIEHSKGIKFPDEDSQRAADEPNPIIPVPSDIKMLIRSLLKRHPVERSSFDEFFGSTALARSKFPRPTEQRGPSPPPTTIVEEDATSEEANRNGKPWTGQQAIPEHHRVIPPEVLDPKAMIPPSKFNFRPGKRTEGPVSPDGGSSSPTTSSPSKPTTPVEISRRPSSHRAPERRPLTTALSPEGSVIPGESEEDKTLRHEYVLVGDTRAVEFNQAVDEISAARRRPLTDRKLPPSPLSDEVFAKRYPTPHSRTPSNDPPIFPPPPNPNAPPLSSSPTSAASRAASNALSRALSLASKKLFGTNTAHLSSRYRDYGAPSSPRRPQIIVGRGQDEEGERDPLEDELLASLEELAQKTDVLTNWADEMYEYVKAIPQKPLPDPTKFAKRDGEAEKQAMRRKNADVEAEYNAVTCVAVYMLLMSFSQKGIDKLRNHQEHMKMRHPDEEFVVSEGFDDALIWFKNHFVKCNNRAAMVKTWLPAPQDSPKSWLDQLVYDRALTLSRTAARKELLDQASSPDECEKLYEESLWCLYALQDDLLQTGNPFLEEDRATIATWIKRTKLRLVRCRARMAMNDRDRLNDARADQNLVDVARYPAPWELRPLDLPQRSPSAQRSS